MTREAGIAGEENLTEKEGMPEIQLVLTMDKRGCAIVDETFIAKYMEAEHSHPVLQHVVEYVKNLRFDRDVTLMAFSSTMGDPVRAEAEATRISEIMQAQHAEHYDGNWVKYVEDLRGQRNDALQATAQLKERLAVAEAKAGETVTELALIKKELERAEVATAAFSNE